MELPVLKIDGTDSGKKVVLDEKVFGVEPNDHAIYLDVVQYLANQRQGTSKTKDRSEIAHSTKKLGRQKGGGGARHGSLKANIFVGGGRVFGPKPGERYRFRGALHDGCSQDEGVHAHYRGPQGRKPQSPLRPAREFHQHLPFFT